MFSLHPLSGSNGMVNKGSVVGLAHVSETKAWMDKGKSERRACLMT